MMLQETRGLRSGYGSRNPRQTLLMKPQTTRWLGVCAPRPRPSFVWCVNDVKSKYIPRGSSGTSTSNISIDHRARKKEDPKQLSQTYTIRISHQKPTMKFTAALSLMVAASASAFAPSINTNARSSSALSMSKVERNPNFAKLIGGYVRFLWTFFLTNRLPHLIVILPLMNCNLHSALSRNWPSSQCLPWRTSRNGL